MNLEQQIDDRTREWLDEPEWQLAGRVHDWRRHVPDRIRAMWPYLSLETRFVAYVMADDAAMCESWD